ncbi:ParB/RepB/Spo0J family partition protein [Streptomyces sp. NPDC091272]|uniref:ParB/RepB/Spo0J family partition protein n=1 Tax=Streptomyces sp. NPDC091272 TaxID=3365981 RepID=UPI0037F48542
MSVADRLGTGSSFGGVPRGRSARGRAKALVQGDVPSYELSRIRLEDVAPTPLNPRRNFGSDEEMTRFGEELRNTQLAACVAISRAAYLKVWPQHEASIGDAQYVLINGERRYRSASHVGLESLDFVVRDDLASSREAFIDHLLKENLEREDFDVVERARGVQQLVLVCSEESATGARARAAKRLGRDRSWVTNQLALLELPEELQGMLSTGSLPERDGRLLARRLKEEPGLGVPGLLGYLREYREQEAQAREEAKALADQIKRTGRTPSETEEAFARRTAAAAAAEGAEDGQVLSADNTTSLLSADNTPHSVAGPEAYFTPVPHVAGPGLGPAAASSGVRTPSAPAPETVAAPVAPVPGSAPQSSAAPAPAAAPAAGTAVAEPAPTSVAPPSPIAVPAQAAEDQQKEEPELLSADNKSARSSHRGGGPAEASSSDAARGLVRQLGASQAEQARTLAAGLTKEELVELIEELHTYM